MRTGLTILLLILLSVAAYASEHEENLSIGYRALQEGRYDSAVNHLISAVNAGSLFSDYATYYLGESYLAKADMSAAFDAFDEFNRRYAFSPIASSAFERIGDIYWASGRYRQASEAYRKLLSLFPDLSGAPDIIFKIAYTLSSDNNHDEALPFLKRLLIEFPQTDYGDYLPLAKKIEKSLTADEFLLRQRALFRQRQYWKIINESGKYLSEIKIEPGSSAGEHLDKIRLILGQAFSQSKNHKRAKEAFFRLYTNASSNSARVESLFWMGKTHINLKEFSEAQEALNAFMSVSSRADKGMRDEALYWLLTISLDRSDIIRADALLKRMTTENPVSIYRPEAMWRIAWFYYNQRRFDEALAALKPLEDSPLRLRAIYWQARIYSLKGMIDDAAGLYRVVADNYPPSYYSAMSRKAIEDITGSKLHAISAAAASDSLTLLTSEEPMPVKRTRALLRLGLNELALRELASIGHRQNILDISLLYREAGDYYTSYILARRHFYNSYSQSAYRFMFMEGYGNFVEQTADWLQIDPLLIYAVMMQESEFDERSISRSGALGLLQLMPATAKMIAKKLSNHSYREQDLFDPFLNINFGGWYLKTLLMKFKGNLPYAVAAYNAGPGAVDEWLRKWGNAPADEFVENIPYQETRKYVEKVLGYYESYKTIHNSRD